MSRGRMLGAAVLAGLIAMATLLGAVWTGSSGAGPVDVPEPAEVSRPEVVVTRWLEPSRQGGALDQGLLREVARGEHGLELRNRVCRLCVGRVLEEAACSECEGLAEAARLDYDIVDQDGRPYPDPVRVVPHCMVGMDDDRRPFWFQSDFNRTSSGRIHLPTGRCRIEIQRMDALVFDDVRPLDDGAEFDVEAGDEVYRTFEMDGRRVGGVGVKLARQVVDDDGRPAWVVTDHIGAAAKGRIPVGSEIVAVDGERVGGTPFIQSHLTGPIGTEVSVRIRYEAASGWVEETVVVERSVIEPHLIGLGGTPG